MVASLRTVSIIALVACIVCILPCNTAGNDAVTHDGTSPLSLLYFFPQECPTDIGECCPASGPDLLTCGGPVRGSCLPMDDPTANRCGYNINDGLGLWWFYTNFRNACVCEGNYWGVSCEGCAPGWTGDTCSERADVRIRRDFSQLADVDKQYIMDAFTTLKNTPAPYQPSLNWFDWIAGGHYWSMRSTAEADLDLTRFPLLTGLSIDPGHDGPASPVYHRRLVFEMEKALAQVTNNVSFVLPYWNWTSSSGNNNDAVIKWFGGDGEGTDCRYFPESLGYADAPKGCDCNVTQGPYAGWNQIGLWGRARDQVLQRTFNCQSKYGPSTPSQFVGDFIPTVPVFYSETNQSWSFRQLLGGGACNVNAESWPTAIGVSEMHKRIHRFMAGSMVGNATASDPIFYMLHGFADLVMERWIRNAVARGWFNNTWNSWPVEGMNVGQNSGDCTAPFLPLVPHVDFFVPSVRLGYDFDYFDGCAASIGDDTGEGCLAAVSPVSRPKASTFSQFESLWPQTTFIAGVSTPKNEAFFFPSQCEGSGRTCCPTSVDGVTCSGNGDCIDVGSEYDNTTGSLWWITARYDSVCSCSSNWDGAACDRCATGFTGTNCTETTTLLRVRRNFESLSETERQVVIDALNTFQNMSSEFHPLSPASAYYGSIYYWALHTGVDQIDLTNDFVDVTTVRGPSMLMMRRRLLLEVERRLGVLIGDETFALPYWDWSRSMQNDNDLTLRWLGGDGDQSGDQVLCRQALIGEDNTTLTGCTCELGREPFASTYTVGNWGDYLTDNDGGSIRISRAFGCRPTAPALPTTDVIDSLLKVKKFHSSDDSTASFWKALSGVKYDSVTSSWPPSGFPGRDFDVYARVHEFLGGTSVGASPASDPLFWLHATFADALLDEWYRSADASERTWPSDDEITTTGHAAGDIVAPFYPFQTNAELFTISDNHGYVYDRVLLAKKAAEVKAAEALKKDLAAATLAAANGGIGKHKGKVHSDTAAAAAATPTKPKSKKAHVAAAAGAAAEDQLVGQAAMHGVPKKKGKLHGMKSKTRL